MRIPTLTAATTLCVALLSLGACTDEVGLAHGDPGRDTGAQTPLVGAAAPPSASRAPAVPDTSNATLASANAVPMSSASNAAPLSTAPPTPLPNQAPPPVGQFSTVIVTFGEHAQALAASDPRLTVARIAAAVEQELQAHHLLAPGSAAPALVISVDDFTSELASNAVVLGYTFRNVMLIGEVTERGGTAHAPLQVHARARLTTRGPGATAGSLAPLYTRFAQLVVADLRGVAPPSEYMPR